VLSRDAHRFCCWSDSDRVGDQFDRIEVSYPDAAERGRESAQWFYYEDSRVLFPYNRCPVKGHGDVEIRTATGVF